MAEESIQDFKTCRKCGVQKPATAAFFYKKPGRLSSRCRPCMREYNRRYREENGPTLLAHQRRRRNADLEKHREITRRNVAKIRAANPEFYRAYSRERHRLNQKNPKYRLMGAVRSNVRLSLLGAKSKPTEELLGYSFDTLRAHLERQFLPGMSGDNYGNWHVDHILPVASFNFSSADDAEFRACWALTNLRPLWAADNLRKSDKRLLLI